MQFYNPFLMYLVKIDGLFDKVGRNNFLQIFPSSSSEVHTIFDTPGFSFIMHFFVRIKYLLSTSNYILNINRKPQILRECSSRLSRMIYFLANAFHAEEAVLRVPNIQYHVDHLQQTLCSFDPNKGLGASHIDKQTIINCC